MPEPKKRSRTLRRIHITTPGGRNIIHYRPRKPQLGTCPITGESLKGVPRGGSSKMQNLPKSSKRPSRPFGGVLSSKASRAILKQRARA